MSEEIRTWYDHYLRIVAGKKNPNESVLINFIKLIEKGTSPSPIEIRYNDEFAPSHSRLDAAYADTWVNDTTRPFFYNDQTSEVAEAALDRAADMGLPRVLWKLPHNFTQIDASAHSEILNVFREVIKNINEGSEDWICLAIYHRWVSACHWTTIGVPVGLIAEHILALGANCRELELVHRNKAEALERKKAKRALANANDGRDVLNAKRRLYANEWRRHANEILSRISGGSSNSARANYIRANWERLGDEGTRPRKPAKKTIENWLSSQNANPQ